jgi:DNA-binding CsgD family transcriptional regulator
MLNSAKQYDFTSDVELIEKIAKRVVGGYAKLGGKSPILEFSREQRFTEDSLQQARLLAIQGLKAYARKKFLCTSTDGTDEEVLCNRKRHAYYYSSLYACRLFLEYLSREVNSLNSCILDAQFESSEDVTGRDTLLSALQSRDTTDMAILSADMAAILSQRQLTVLKHILAGYSTAEIERAGIAARMTITRTRRRVLEYLVEN